MPHGTGKVSSIIIVIAEASPLTGSQVPSGTGRIWLDNVRCRGTENRLIDCPANVLGVHNCNHNEDAGVACVDSGEC